MSGLLCLKWNNHSSSILKKLNFILQKECYCDVTLVSQGNYYPVHRFVLSTCSEYFDEIFERSECKHPFIILKDINVTELEALLNYMYNGEVNVLQETLPGLIKAAEYLRIKGLAVQDEYESDSPPAPPPPLNKGSRKRSYGTSPSSRSKRCRKKEDDDEDSNTEVSEKELPASVDGTLDSSQVEESAGSDLNNRHDSPTIPDPSQIADRPIKLEAFDFDESNGDRAADFRSDGNTESFPTLETFMSPRDDTLQDSSFEKTIVKTEEELAQCSNWDEDDQRNSNSDPHQGEMCELNTPALGDRTLEAISLALSMHERISPGDKSTAEAPSSSPSKPDKNTSVDLSNMVYECCYCPFISPVRSIWREHCFENHPGNHLYACKLCKYQTSVKSLLNRHMLVHNGEKRYKCDYCPYRTAYSFNMKTHLLKHKEVML